MLTVCVKLNCVVIARPISVLHSGLEPNRQAAVYRQIKEGVAMTPAQIGSCVFGSIVHHEKIDIRSLSSKL